MSEEIKKLDLKDLENAAGGKIGEGGDGGYKIVDGSGNTIGTYYNTLEEAKFAASGICPRCGKVFSGKQAIDGHIKEWATGKK